MKIRKGGKADRLMGPLTLRPYRGPLTPFQRPASLSPAV